MYSRSALEAFEDSCACYTQYPTNLTYRTLYQGSLCALQEKLRVQEARLCADEEDLDVGFLDLSDQDEICNDSVTNIQTIADLEQRLNGYAFEKTTIPKEDPQRRFIFLWSDDSRSKLNVTLNALSRILTFHQVHPDYIDCVTSFGHARNGHGVNFNRFRTHDYYSRSHPVDGAANLTNGGMIESTTKHLLPAPALPELGRSGQCFQICWSLKSVSKRALSKGAPEEWYTRSACFYHQFDIVNGRALWITVSGRQDLQHRVQDMTSCYEKQNSITVGTAENSLWRTFETHLLFCQWAVGNWSEYLLHLEEAVEEETSMIIDGDCEPGRWGHIYNPSSLQDIQRREDRVHAAHALLKANVETLSSLHTFYRGTGTRFVSSHKDHADKIAKFLLELGGYTTDIRLLVGRVEALSWKTSSRKTLATQYLHSQSLEETGNLAKAAQRETIAMRVIAFVTILYLPATFTSSLFSTDIIKYQDPVGFAGERLAFSLDAFIRWVQISIPLTLLTVITILIWYFWDNGRLRCFGSRKKHNIRTDDEEYV